MPYLSDDEQLDATDDSAMLNTLRRGVLPPETSVLFALCLMQEGGRNFIAKKCFESIDLLEQETREWVLESVVDSDLANDPHWQIFRSAASEPLGRTAAYALVADVLPKIGNESVWSKHFNPMFVSQMNVLDEEGLVAELLSSNSGLTPASRDRRNKILQVVLAWCRMQITSASDKLCSAKQGSVDGAHSNEDTKVAVESMIDAIKSMKKYLNISGSQTLFTKDDGSISLLGVEVSDEKVLKLLPRYGDVC